MPEMAFTRELTGGERMKLFFPDDLFSRYVLDEVFNKQCYPSLAFVDSIRTIVDIGANAGASAAYFRGLYPKATIHAFEPDPDAFGFLARNSHVIGCTPHNLGLHKGDRSLQFYKGANSSVHNSVHAHAYTDEIGREILLRDAATALDAAGIARIDLLKVDTEGCEVPILESLFARTPDIRIIYLEAHSETDRRTLESMLAASHILYSATVERAHRAQIAFVRRDLASPEYLYPPL